MAVFKGVATEKSQRKTNRRTTKADRSKRTKIKVIAAEAAKLRGKR